MGLKKITNQLTSILLASGLLFVNACAVYEDDDDDSGDDTSQQEEQNDEGDYRTVVVPVNQIIVNNITTINNIKIIGDDIDIDIVVRGVPRSIRHRQHIHRGQQCPGPQADQNQDGYIDGPEMQAAVDGVIIPLDGDVNTQDDGSDFFPTASSAGIYNYQEQGSFSRMMADLRSPDLDPEDQYVKLDPSEDLNLDNRVFVIYGIPEGTILPLTVAGFPGQSRQESFPIGCGTLSQFSTTGGTQGGTTGGTSGGTSVGGTSGGTSVGGTSGGSSGGSSGGTSVGGTSGGGTSTGGSSGGASGGTSSGGSEGGSSGGI